MNLTPWRRPAPAGGGLARLRNEVDRIFEQFFVEPWGAIEPKDLRSEGWLPAIDMSETDIGVTVRAEIPGIPVKDLDISISGNTLSISGEKEEKQEKKQENFYHCERRFGSFRRVIELPETVDPDKVTAESDNGVVTIHVAKKPGVRPRKVEVKPTTRKVAVDS